MGKDTLQDRAINLIKPLVPPDAEDRVKRSFKQWNQIVREHIRNETALRLSDGEGTYSVPVRIEDGFPVSLVTLINEYNDPVLWRLIIGQPKLGGMIEGLQFLLGFWHEAERWPHLPEVAKQGESHLGRSLDIANALQLVALARKVRNELKEIREDILGAYHFGVNNGPRVALYWLPIAMVAAMLDVRIEDLTVVVLAHELTHGYTHVGRDIDGIQWDDRGFAETEAHIVEGLAQFYTEVVTEKLSARNPGPKDAYEKLLRIQRGPYLAHRTWLRKEPKHRGEAIRFAMVLARHRQTCSRESWATILTSTGANLKSGEKQKKLFEEE
mgnify:CR=1 FL=1